jgi:hypothetical protein
VASPLCYIFTLWLERTGDASFSLIPPKAIMSSIFFGLEDGVEGEKGTAAIHGVSFSHPAGGASEGFELLHPLFLAEGERGAVFFALMKGEAIFFCPCKNVPELSEEARKESLVGKVKLGPSTSGPTGSQAAGDDGLVVAAEKTAPAAHPAEGKGSASTTAGSTASSPAPAAKAGAPCATAGWTGLGKYSAPAAVAERGDADGETTAVGSASAAAF